MNMALEDFFDFIARNKNIMTTSECKNHNILTFAFVGDALFSLYVRTFVANNSTAKSGVLHIKTTKYVKASYQAKLIDLLNEYLNENEHHIVLTARNAKTNNIAKHSNLEEYKKSTSFEALLGYLYLTHQMKRIDEILNICKNEMEKDL